MLFGKLAQSYKALSVGIRAHPRLKLGRANLPVTRGFAVLQYKQHGEMPCQWRSHLSRYET